MVDAIHSKVEVRVRVIRASEKQNYAISVHVCFATFSTRHHLLNTFAGTSPPSQVFRPPSTEEFNSSTALGLLESTKTRTLQVTVINCSIDDCTCTMSDGTTPGKKCDGYEACSGVNPDNVGCGSCNHESACKDMGGESS